MHCVSCNFLRIPILPNENKCRIRPSDPQLALNEMFEIFGGHGGREGGGGAHSGREGGGGGGGGGGGH